MNMKVPIYLPGSKDIPHCRSENNPVSHPSPGGSGYFNKAARWLSAEIIKGRKAMSFHYFYCHNKKVFNLKYAFLYT